MVYNPTHYKKNKSKILADHKVYYDLHKDEIVDWQKDWNLKNRHKIRRLPSTRYTMLKSYAKKKEHPFTINKQEYFELISKPCYYCKNSLLEETGGGLDRIDNNKGYVIENVLPCCGTCNKIRGASLTVEEALVAIRAVLAYRNIGD